ncbi:MAG: DNA methyltransferase [Chloroflexota bacterium]
MSFADEPSLEEQVGEDGGGNGGSGQGMSRRARSVECLGITFESEEARRVYFTEKLREKLKDPEFRRIEGFPIGEDEDILRLSDPPYYTACPNPWIDDFVRLYGKPFDPAQPYSREPMAVDVSEGKTDPLYAAHSYHTKVPYKAIVRAILHYTEPGDLVLDGFAGSGMVGVAAQICGKPDAQLKSVIEAEWLARKVAAPKWGARQAILNDLSPAATFIAANYNLPFDLTAFTQAGQQLLREVEKEIGWMYETLHTDGMKGRIEYTVWSQVFVCPECGREITFLEEALDEGTGRVRASFPCPHCSADLNKDRLEKAFDTRIDPGLATPWKRVKFRPVLITYAADGQRYEKKPDDADLAVLAKVDAMPLPASVPKRRFPIEQMYHGSRLAPKGFTHVHHLYLPRAAQALGLLWEKASRHSDLRIRDMLLYLVEQGIRGMSLLNRYKPLQYGRLGGSQAGLDMPGVYYVSSIGTEVSPWYQFEGKLSRLDSAFGKYVARSGLCMISTGTAAPLGLSSDYVDYIFTDPPFGENIYYADLNYLVESWHRVWTDSRPEAIVDRAKGKGLLEYQELMTASFREYHRVLKPGRWMTVVFHNSSNAVWNAIQEAMQAAGFVVADVRTLDKQQGSYRQVTSTAVKQDLVISAYKPNQGLEKRFQLEAGSEEGVWEFVRNHLKQLPGFVPVDGHAEAVAERAGYLLFDRMVAFHVQRGVLVPMSAAEFYAGLKERFPERDGMYFLPNQVVEYDRKRQGVKEVFQLELAPTDEATAIQWLRQQLERKPQTFQDIHPEFTKAIAGWERHEQRLELREMLAHNFLRYEGSGPIPEPIWAWMQKSAILREMMEGQDRENPSAALREEAKDRWYMPDPSRAQDLERLRERALLKEFEEYKAFKGRQMKLFRMEAVRTGFKKAWQERDYQTIIDVAAKIPDEVLQEDPKLLMWYYQALTRSGA